MLSANLNLQGTSSSKIQWNNARSWKYCSSYFVVSVVSNGRLMFHKLVHLICCLLNIWRRMVLYFSIWNVHARLEWCFTDENETLLFAGIERVLIVVWTFLSWRKFGTKMYAHILKLLLLLLLFSGRFQVGKVYRAAQRLSFESVCVCGVYNIPIGGERAHMV